MRKTLRTVRCGLLSAGLLLFLAACGKDPDCGLTENLCSCDLRTTSTNSCKDFEGQSRDSAKGSCSGGTFSESSACPSDGRVGTCKTTVSSNKTYTRYYSNAGTNQAGCTVASLGTGFLGLVEWTSN